MADKLHSTLDTIHQKHHNLLSTQIRLQCPKAGPPTAQSASLLMVLLSRSPTTLTNPSSVIPLITSANSAWSTGTELWFSSPLIAAVHLNPCLPAASTSARISRLRSPRILRVVDPAPVLIRSRSIWPVRGSVCHQLYASASNTETHGTLTQSRLDQTACFLHIFQIDCLRKSHAGVSFTQSNHRFKLTGRCCDSLLLRSAVEANLSHVDVSLDKSVRSVLSEHWVYFGSSIGDIGSKSIDGLCVNDMPHLVTGFASTHQNVNSASIGSIFEV